MSNSNSLRISGKVYGAEDMLDAVRKKAGLEKRMKEGEEQKSKAILHLGRMGCWCSHWQLEHAAQV